ncbi:MAG: permease [Candidatus Riflebacteria bacterium]|nr:permease [Candidatus Riflebacteria bacterium]
MSGIEIPSCETPVSEKKNKGGRAPKSNLEKSVLLFGWIGLVAAFIYRWFIYSGTPSSTNFFAAASIAGSKDLIEFLSTHLVSAMIPAFFVASAISTFFSKETVIKTLGRDTSRYISYPLAAIAGGVLTVCSCGILPIFMSIYQSGAGLGVAFTFLYASPAINLISLIYTWKVLPYAMLWARILSVFFCSIAIGLIIGYIYRKSDLAQALPENTKKNQRTPLQDWTFFGLLIIVMISSTDALSFISSNIIPAGFFSSMTPDAALQAAAFAGKILMLTLEIILVLFVLRKWFTLDETQKWLKKTWRQATEILPMVFLGIFYSGFFFGGAPAVVDHLSYMKTNTLMANLVSSFIGAILYFGSIVGVNVVDLFVRWGMHKGPALALLLAGPSVSLPSILALSSIAGKEKAAVYLLLVVIFSTLCGMIFGSL